MKIAIHHLKLIHCLEEEKSLTGAAKVLHLTQPALSHQLKELEGTLNIRLFNRVGKKMMLTEAGRKVLDSSRLILGELRKLQSEIDDIKSGKTETIRISTECYTCYHWLPSKIRQFQNSEVDVTIKIVTEATRRPYEYLGDGRIDLAISSSRPENHHITVTKLFSDELVAVVSTVHPMASRKSVSSTDFSNETYLSYDVADADSNIITNFFKANHVTPRSIAKIQLTEAIIEMVKANLGITIMAKWAVTPYLKSSEIVQIPLRSSVGRRTWYAGYLGKPSNSMLQLIELMKAGF